MLTATVGHGTTAFWYLTRATGLVAFVLLSATVVLGIIASVGWVSEHWPRYGSQSLHRNLSLLALVFIGIHIITTVADGYVPITLLDAVVPFGSPYRPLWVGLGSVAFDLLLAVAITSGVRRRLGAPTWRAVHWLAYLCWPIALLHAIGTGSDARLFGAQAPVVVCVLAVAAAVVWRLVDGRGIAPSWRIGGAVAAIVMLVGTAIFAIVGPLRPGWSQRAGTSSSVLTQLRQVNTTSSSSSSSSAP